MLDEAELPEPPQAPLDRRDRADVEERQLLQGERLALPLVVADLADEMVILHRTKEMEVLPFERPEGAQLLEQAHRLLMLSLCAISFPPPGSSDKRY